MVWLMVWLAEILLTSMAKWYVSLPQIAMRASISETEMNRIMLKITG